MTGYRGAVGAADRSWAAWSLGGWGSGAGGAGSRPVHCGESTRGGFVAARARWPGRGSTSLGVRGIRPSTSGWRSAVGRRAGRYRVRHPAVGEFTPAYESLRLPDDPDQTLIMYTAEAGSPSEAALRIIAGTGRDTGAGGEGVVSVRGGVWSGRAAAG
ncbi:hypothetical protein ACN20G_26305 [Streptomyces sp. BI20]|uniref:MmyB family transcriptional regulator n=1 Tax=Streptomyces sp. BI20 TaxID=3403460 RepID=UPI003C78B737